MLWRVLYLCWRLQYSGNKSETYLSSFGVCLLAALALLITTRLVRAAACTDADRCWAEITAQCHPSICHNDLSKMLQ